MNKIQEWPAGNNTRTMKSEAQWLKRNIQGAMSYAIPLYRRPSVWRHVNDNAENDRSGPFWEDVKQTVDRLVGHSVCSKSPGEPWKVAPMTPCFFGAVAIEGPRE